MYNRVELIGHLGQDPAETTFENGGKIVKATIATTEKWTDKNTGEVKEATEWHNLVFHDRQAETAIRNLKKGSKIFAEGKLTTQSWEKDGVKRYTTSIMVNRFLFLDGKKD